MGISNFLRKRRSVREFRNRRLDSNTLETISKIVEKLPKNENNEHIKLKLYVDGDNIAKSLEGKAGYGGVMINSPHYVSLQLMDNDEKTLINAGFYMEELITEITNLNLGTCWIQLGHVSEDLKKELFGYEKGKVDFLLAIGKEKRRNPFNERPYSVKKGVEELVYDTEIEKHFEVEDLENKGLMDIFYYIRFAPSTKNLQPWRFLIKDSKISFLLRYDEWYDSILIDAGIAMYYFEQLAHYDGFNSKWELVKPEEIKTSEFTYRKIAEFKL